ncbi:PKD domain-containing protein [Pedobacter sp. BS3]|uniref:PKD domain-containing protein n=1 Tax=Pedobacter sp. BS3 TaxID=2567937 RepID=UPI001658F856|nr:gliding motility-associated C-terminal domain-containing protein [Pedobacter sp. BS3]
MAQNSSNKGKDFWVVYMGHVNGPSSKMTLFLSADQATNYQVFIGTSAAPLFSGTIPANSATPVTIDPSSAYVSTSETIESGKGVHVVTNVPISLYSVISYQAQTGGTMVLPTSALGKLYYAFSYQSKSLTTGNNNNPVYSEFAIVATEDGTVIQITPTKASRNNQAANQSYTVTLDKGDVYQYQSADDLSGSYIEVLNCKPIAVFSGSSWINFCEPGNNKSAGSGDNLYQQVFPVEAWGKNFVTAPFYNATRGSQDIFRIIVSEDNTNITIKGNINISLSNPYNKGSIITFYSAAPVQISATKPIGVAQYQTSQGCNVNNSSNSNVYTYPGDPEITMLNPVEQTLDDITVYSKLGSVGEVSTNINVYYLNIIIKTADASSFQIDGVSYSASFTAIPNSDYSYAIINVTNLQEQHHLTANGGFSAIAYGYGKIESYAYLAGANVQNFTFEVDKKSTPAQVITSGCVGEPMAIKINLLYPALKLEWNIGDGKGTVTDNNPSPAIFQKDGKTYYSYTYPGDAVYTAAGDYSWKVTVTRTTASSCGATEDITSDFTINPPPVAGFTAPAEACIGDPVKFIDKSDGKGSDIIGWHWDFGDGTTSDVQNPEHIFTAAQTYQVKLAVSTKTSCDPAIITQSVIINKAAAKFSPQAIICEQKEAVFTDISQATGGAITSWMWDFGDGTKETLSSDQARHTYAAAGRYTVSLQVKTDKGCISEPYALPITVYPTPVPDFEMPDVCLSDAKATFTNKSTISDHTGADFTYLWNFGDSHATAVNPNSSTEKDPSHRYGEAGNYTVTLTVTSKYGCSETTVKTFTVNGAQPHADFTIQNAAPLCSNQPVIFTDNSTVDFGKITRVEWYFDADNDPTGKEAGQPGQPHPHTYPAFTSPATKTYTVKLVAYSGISCANTVSREITLYASPAIQFNDLQSVCQNAEPFMVTQAKETGNVPGAGTYSGDGITASGLFDPAKAGPGTHTITYTFNAANGCQDIASKDITVWPVPTVNAGNDTVMLYGGSIRLHGRATGYTSVKWEPAAGLSNPNILDPVLTSPEKDTQYTLTAISANNCSVSDEVNITILKAPKVPNTFTPNGDGRNDTWAIEYLGSYPGCTVDVFNRYGVRVYHSVGYTVPWDGRANGQDLPTGTYYYIINPRNGRNQMTGYITIVR